MKKIQLTQGKVALVDDEDFDFLNQFNWHAKVSKTKFRNYWYAVRNQKDSSLKTIMMQQEVYRLHSIRIDKGKRIVFDNKNTLDIRKQNLKTLSISETFQTNRPRRNKKSKYKGVAIQNGGGGKWRAQIFVNGKQKVLGTFNDEIEAAKKYDEAALKYFGEHAGTNVKLNLLSA